LFEWLAPAAGPPGSVQLADLQALQPSAPLSLHTMQPAPLPPPNLASLPPHVLRDYLPIRRAGSAGSVSSEVPLLGECLDVISCDLYMSPLCSTGLGNTSS
jgi:hypothetical protein